VRRSTRRSLGTVVSAALVAGTVVVAPPIAGAAVPAGGRIVFDDMEHGDPLGNGWFSFNGDVGGGGIAANSTDLPPIDGGAFSLESGWGSGGNPGFYGGFGRTSPTDLSGTDHFNFWINPDAGQEYTLEVNLQEDDNGDDLIAPEADDEYQFNCVISDIGPCAVSGGGWQLVSLPLAEFFRDTSFLFGGNGDLDPVPTAAGGNGQLINVVVAVIGSGSDVNFRTDYWVFSDGEYVPSTLIDDFENGLPFGSAVPNGEPVGFYTFQGDGSVSINTTDEPSTQPPAAESPNSVLQMDVDVSSFAGYIHAFENGAVDAWVTQDWSTSEGISLWMYGQDSETDMFIDILDNRNPGSTTDDAERFTATFVDDFAGWQKLEFPFDSFVRKEIGNGAPNDGLGLFAMHGYAIGTLGTGGPRTFYFDDVARYGIGEPPALAVNFAQQNTFIEEGTTGDVAVTLNRPMGPDDPTEVSIDFATERSNATPGQDFTPTSGTLTFTNGGPTELTFPVETFDNTKFTGDKQIVIRLTNPVDVERGALFQGSVLIDDNDPFDPKLLDDFEQGAYLWSADPNVRISTPAVSVGDNLERPEQDAVENVMRVSEGGKVKVLGGTCKPGKKPNQSVIPVHLLSTADFDATAVDHTTVRFGEATETHTKKDGTPKRHVDDVDGDGLKDLIFHFRANEVGLECPTDATLTWVDALGHDFAAGQDWTGTETLDFWFKGSGSGDDVTVTLKDNRAADPGPGGWDLAWADEFDDPAGTTPSPANWSYEIGDTTPDGKNGWGNEESQYYTDDKKNAQTDGDGNLVITLDEADGSQECYYGPCEYESARLITQHKAEFAYGRVESRLKVPSGGDGLWPAFWSLGTDITYNPWPGAGEIDIMEYVSRLPNEIFGTVHGPGYSGGASIGDIYDFGERVDSSYHTYAVEWQPNLIVWYVDGIEYHRVTPADLPGPWVFDKPFFLLLNFAIGGNFGGPIDPDITYPQEYLVDYVRVFQGPDTAERFEATFTDSSAEWAPVSIPMTDFVRSADQPAGAPDDGLGLDEVWGYGFELPFTAGGTYHADLVRRTPFPPPTELTVTNLDDSGPGSLREALALIADDGTITFDAGLAGGTLALTSGQLAVDSSVTIDGPRNDPITISGDGQYRVFQVAAGAAVSMDDLVISDGVGAPQGGGILNLGDLSLDRVLVTGNTQGAAGPANFEFGGGGIYNGDGATLALTDSTVSDNSSVNQPGGGIYGFFNSEITIERSTVSGNVSGDVAGGLRSLGDTTILNSTFSGNTSTAWHGGAVFATDGSVTITNSTIVGNNAPGGTAGGLMVATFGAPVDVSIVNTIIADNGTYNCQVEGNPDAAVLTSLGNNVVTDSSCAAIGSDIVVAPGGGAGVDALADNGGPTLTHALLAGSPAINTADSAAAPETDQRGVTRPQGDGPDVGAFELE
jgi:beta-glucanase (GH16 family)